MTFQELIKILTREFVVYVDTPKEERLKRRLERKESRTSWSEHWFGILPLGLKMGVNKYSKLPKRYFHQKWTDQKK